RELESEADAAAWYERIKRAEHVVKEIKALLRARIAARPVTLSDGHQVRLAKEVRRRLDGKVALRLMTERFGPEVAQQAAEVKVTQASIRAASGEMADDVLRWLDDAGAVVRYDQLTLRVSKARSR